MNTCNSPLIALFLYDAPSEYRIIYLMRLTKIFNICIAVAVYSNNVTFGNNVSTVFEMSAIHTGGKLRRCSRLVTAAQRPWEWVREGGFRLKEAQRMYIQGSGWLRIHLPAITVQQKLQ